MRLIGLVSVLILARTLTPADFGIVALAMATLAVVDAFSALGLKQALLRVKDPDRSHYDTVWTIQLFVLVGLAIILIGLSPVMAWFYDEPVLAWIIAILATRFVFYGLANIGIVDFERNLEFGRDLKMRLTVRLTTLVVTIAAALILRNYWALVIGAVLQGALHCAASYAFHPFRPRFSLAHRAAMLGVSIWMFLANFAATLTTEFERFVVGRIGSLGGVGFYSVSKDLSAIFTNEIATALNRVTFVTTAKTGTSLGEDPVRLRSMLGAYALIVAPLGVGIAAIAENFVLVLLGDQWQAAAPFLQFLAPAAACYAVFKLIISSLQASGKAKLAALVAMMAAGLTASIVGATAYWGGTPVHVAQSALGVMAASLVIALVILKREENVGLIGLIASVGRPFAAAVIMLIAIRLVGIWPGPPFVAMISAATFGALIYSVGVASVWIISNRADGAEANLWAFLTEARRQANDAN